MEEKINLEDVDNFLDGYELPELHKEACLTDIAMIMKL